MSMLEGQQALEPRGLALNWGREEPWVSNLCTSVSLTVQVIHMHMFSVPGMC